MTNSDNNKQERQNDNKQERQSYDEQERKSYDEQEKESYDEQERESDDQQEEKSDDQQEEESDNEQEEESDNEQEEYEESDNEQEEYEESDNEQEEYKDELNYKKQILKSFCNYLEVVIKSIDDKKHNKKIINKLYYIIDIYYKNNKDSEIVKIFNTNQVNLKKKENNIFESFINKTIDINKRLIKADDIHNSILYLNNFITNSLFF